MVNLQLHQSFHWRLVILGVFFFIMLSVVAARVFSLSIVDHREFTLVAERQHLLAEVLPSARGTISVHDKNGVLQPLAIQKSFFTLVAIPKNIVNPEETARELAGLLDIPEAEISKKIQKRDDPHEVVARKLEPERADRVRLLNVNGLVLLEERRRYYPEGTLGANILGFVSYQDGNEVGEYGIERSYENYLRGERGFFEVEKDMAGYWVALGRRILNPPVDGDNIVLTIDPQIQFRLEQELATLMEKWQGGMALGVVLDPKTGRILAMGSRPTFDPNEYSQEDDFSVFRNPVVDSQFELGSVMKPVTMAAGIDAGVVTPKTTYVDPGTIRYDEFTVRNYDGKSHGIPTMSQVLEKSLNTGAIFVAERLGKERFLDALSRFGFGAPTEVDFPGEVSGDISNLSSWRDVDFATAAFGQGIAVTPLQMASAIAAIANGGMLMRPYIVEKIIDAAGNEEVRGPLSVRRVISPESAETLSKMLVSVAQSGFDQLGTVRGYHMAAKTGTAQIPNSSGRGYSDELSHTFIGYGPAFDPRYLVLLQITKPKGVLYAATSLTPSYRSLAEFILHYYEVPPDIPEPR